MQVVGYIIGVLFIVLCVVFAVYNIIKLVMAIKQRKQINKEKEKSLEDEKKGEVD